MCGRVGCMASQHLRMYYRKDFPDPAVWYVHITKKLICLFVVYAGGGV